MSKLTISSSELLDFYARNLSNYKIAYIFDTTPNIIYCDKTAIEVLNALFDNIFPDVIDWKYPEQILTDKQLIILCENIKKAEIKNYTILTTSIIFLGWLHFDEKKQVVIKDGKRVEYDIPYGYGRTIEQLWEFQQ